MIDLSEYEEYGISKSKLVEHGFKIVAFRTKAGVSLWHSERDDLAHKWAIHHRGWGAFFDSRRDCLIYAYGRRWIPRELIVDDDADLFEHPFPAWRRE